MYEEKEAIAAGGKLLPKWETFFSKDFF